MRDIRCSEGLRACDRRNFVFGIGCCLFICVLMSDFQRNMKRVLLIFCVSGFLLFLLACERNQRDVGARSKPVSAPDFKTAADISAAPTQLAVLGSFQVNPDAPVDGKKLFATHCSACHQLDGKGIPGAFPPLDNSPYVTGDNVERMGAIMVYGLVGPIEVLGVQYNSAMAPLGQTLNDKELAAVSTYVRSAWSNKASAVSEEVFAKVREKWGSRGMFNIQELDEE